jgi:hypothetical protein
MFTSKLKPSINQKNQKKYEQIIHVQGEGICKLYYQQSIQII